MKVEGLMRDCFEGWLKGWVKGCMTGLVGLGKRRAERFGEMLIERMSEIMHGR